MVCLLLFSVGSVQSSIQLSVGFRVYERSVSVRCLQRSGRVLFSGSFSVCTDSSVSEVFKALALHQESVMFMSCSESTL